ncbi:MAG: hypothetical protein AAFQ94_21855 [Bacteroidota bacterium]
MISIVFNRFIHCIFNRVLLCLYAIFCLSIQLTAQTKSYISPKKVIQDFVEATGGFNWKELKSREENSFINWEEGKNMVVSFKDYNRKKINLYPGNSMDFHQYLSGKTTIYVDKTDCNWYHSSQSNILKFFGPDVVDFKDHYPQTELMDILNLTPRKQVHIEDTLLRIDFIDKRMLKDTHSLYFGQKSGLLYKRKWINKNSNEWEYEFSEYKEKQGISEPRFIQLKNNGENFLSITIDDIKYNVEIDKKLFTPPGGCKNEDTYQYLDETYVPEL